MMHNNKIFLICLLFILLTGCIQSEQIEKIGIVNAVGLDVTDNELLEATLVMFQFSPHTDMTSEIRYGRGYTLRDAIRDVDHSTSYKLTPGKIKLQVFGKDIAKQGISLHLDLLNRNAQITDRLYVTISDTTAKEILSIDESTLGIDSGQYLFELIESESIQHNIPRKTLQDYFRIYYEVGKDNVLPIFSVQEGVPKQSAIAILSGDRYVGEISNEESILINLINSKVKEQLINITLPIDPFKQYMEKGENENTIHRDIVRTTFSIKKSKGKTKLKSEDDLQFQSDIYLDLTLLEQSAELIIKNDHIIKLLEKEVEKNLTTRFQDLLEKLQDMNADPFGYGSYYRTQPKNDELNDKEWREKFPDIKVDFKVHVDVVRTGITE